MLAATTNSCGSEFLWPFRQLHIYIIFELNNIMVTVFNLSYHIYTPHQVLGII